MAIVLLGISATPSAASSETPLRVSFEADEKGFALVRAGHAATLLGDYRDYAVVSHAIEDLAKDIGEVSGVTPLVHKSRGSFPQGPVVLVGTLGKSAPVDKLVKSGKLDVSNLRGAWESFLIGTIERPAAGAGPILAIVGSDRRGTAFGVYELSQAIGQSPWNWWADVPAHHHETIVVPAGVRRFGPPSVRYRGLFINDEDWGLHPWAAKTFEPAAGGIGPKTYGRIFELLLRLKANTLWPAMHKVSAPFNRDPRNAALADQYAIVMGSSHAEPMLRDNVGEWKDTPANFNYAINRKGVLDYWTERVRQNARYESLWTLGMRGIHDSGMVGATSLSDKVALLYRVITDQRQLLARFVNKNLQAVPQVFIPYKEVLELYRNGLNIPEDVTLIWPDDNFGYLRHFANESERARSGGSGIYYHLSYLGPPLSYIWLSTTPPALIAEETRRAHDAGAQRVWIANVGDIKPAETDISFFLEQAWDIERWRGRSQREFLDDWATRTFGANVGSAIGAVLDSYYRLNFERRPEHLQWWLPGERPRDSSLDAPQIAERLQRFDEMVAALAPIEASLLPSQKDAFFELVGYPVRASAAANVRYFEAERYKRKIDSEPPAARAAAARALDADANIKELTRKFNEEIAGGKWRYIMAAEPADNQWPEFRISPLALPSTGMIDPKEVAGDDGDPKLTQTASAGDAAALLPDRISGWTQIEGLGQGQGTLLSSGPGATVHYRLNVSGPTRDIILELLPSFGTATPDRLELSVSVDGRPHDVHLARDAERGDWARAVLDNIVRVPVGVPLSVGQHDLEIRSMDAGVGIRSVRLEGAPRS